MKNHFLHSFLIALASCKTIKTNITQKDIKGSKKETLYIQRVVDTLVAIDTITIDGSSAFESDIDLKSPEMLYLDRGKQFIRQ
jgi:uncharacterized lipoprotein NlpE involved in copper resistance